MEFIYQMAVVLEIIVINLFLTHVCAVKKYRTAVIVAVQLLFTLALVAVSVWTLSRLPFYGNGNGLFVFVGFAYLLPIHFLYRDPPMRSLIIMCSAWVYTLIVFSISVQAGYLLDGLPFTLTVLVTQTLLFAGTLYFFLRFMRRVFLYILENVNHYTQKFLTRTNLLWFVLIFFIHLSYIFPTVSSLKIVALVFLFFCALQSYRLIGHIIRSAGTVDRLEAIVRIDSLTKLRSRASFFEDAYELIRRGAPFDLIYIDLDRFKSVNDQYGHQAGDRYLARFADRAQEALRQQGTLYRLAGDEFVCIYTGADPAPFAERLAEQQANPAGKEAPFLGASTGLARFPEDARDLDQLIFIADQNMYRAKNAKSCSCVSCGS